ncbi:MAG: class I SAM-dependent methyltransferase, partial [Methanosarcinales archaeon]|nr:class I SAM-dependent methyltransferase [Methanosarcinales archaeon]
MPENDLSIEEIENLSYYDFMSYLGVPFYQIGGLTSTEKLGGLCQIDEDKKVLVIGCGTGFNACYIVRKFGCRLVGVDIAEEAIKKAKERAESENLRGRVEFRVGDAYALPFEAGTFDAVITQFVSQFLDMEKALKEFVRVLKTGGCVGINEIFKDKDM